MPDSGSQTTPVVHASGTFQIGDRTIHRLGYGAMQITGDGVWGEPADRDEAIRVLQRAVELGVDFIDTADSYGPEVSERLIAEALHPYPAELLVATKAGLTRQGPQIWNPVGREEYLWQQLELSLRRLKTEQLDLWQLHRIDPKVPEQDQFKVLVDAQDQGRVAAVGLSQISVAQLERALDFGVKVATVQNMYNLVSRDDEDVLEACERHGIGFIPWFPIASGSLAEEDGPLKAIAAEHEATPSQLALAWLLKRSPVILPIPGTKTVAHVEQNCAAAAVELTDEEFEALDAAGRAAE